LAAGAAGGSSCLLHGFRMFVRSSAHLPGSKCVFSLTTADVPARESMPTVLRGLRCLSRLSASAWETCAEPFVPPSHKARTLKSATYRYIVLYNTIDSRSPPLRRPPLSCARSVPGLTHPRRPCAAQRPGQRVYADRGNWNARDARHASHDDEHDGSEFLHHACSCGAAVCRSGMPRESNCCDTWACAHRLW
jgi:hypothetical protein